MKALIIDATIRDNSRTKKLLDYFLSCHKEYEIKHLKLIDLDLKPLDYNTLIERDNIINNKDFNNPKLYLANEVKEADILIYVTPFYDLSFSSLIKLFIENVNVANYIFYYDLNSNCISNCKCQKSYYITTAGAVAIDDFGFNYIKEVNRLFFGIKDTILIKAEMLDIDGFNPEEELKKSYQKITLYETIKSKS